MTLGELAEEMRLTGVMQGGRVGHGVEVMARMFGDQGCTVFLSLTGPLVAGGLRLVIRDLVLGGHVDALVTNGANMVHDLLESMGVPHLAGSDQLDDEEVYREGYSRAYDIFIEASAFPELEGYVKGLLGRVPREELRGVGFSEFLALLGGLVEDEGSILRAAAQKGVPIFSPGFLDCMLGIPLWLYAKESGLSFDPLKDFDRFADMVYEAERTGAILLGGGTPKHHTQYLNTLRGGLDYAVQISSARVEDGSLSGAPLRESITWGKLKEGRLEENAVTIFGEVTSLFPFMVGAALERLGATR